MCALSVLQRHARVDMHDTCLCSGLGIGRITNLHIFSTAEVPHVALFNVPGADKGLITSVPLRCLVGCLPTLPDGGPCHTPCLLRAALFLRCPVLLPLIGIGISSFKLQLLYLQSGVASSRNLC